MKITLVQSDIIAAVRAHIASQGIALEGKTVDIKFTMKRLGTGIVADVTIENGLALPDLSDPSDGDEVVQRPQLAVVASKSAAVPVNKPEPDFVPAPVVADPVTTQVTEDASATDTAAAGPAVDPAPAVKTISLFS